ncbi:3429_t:CDS:2, partial [Entrophospora sp. SA101]
GGPTGTCGFPGGSDANYGGFSGFSEELFSSIFDGVKDNLIQLGSDIEISFMELVKGAKQTTAIETIAFWVDDVWLTIAQCISRHIWNNAERFRYLFVSHEGHEDVFVDARDIIGYVNQNFIGDWSQAISRLSKTIDKRVKKVGLKQHLECDFSISTISWYEPVITQFVAIYKGDVDEIFWSMVIFNTPYSSGIPTPCWDGWIGALFPYGKSEGKIMNNTIIPDEVPSGLVHVPFNLGILAESFKLKFAAGFFGARQVKVNDEYVISPVIG